MYSTIKAGRGASEADRPNDFEEHPWANSNPNDWCGAPYDERTCCLDPDHGAYNKLLDYLAERVVSKLMYRGGAVTNVVATVGEELRPWKTTHVIAAMIMADGSLVQGRALCGFMADCVLSDWPDGHNWVSVDGTVTRHEEYSPPVTQLENCVAELRESLKECVGAGTEHYDEGEPPGLFQLGYQSESGAIEIDFEAQAICDRARAAISRSDR